MQIVPSTKEKERGADCTQVCAEFYGIWSDINQAKWYVAYHPRLNMLSGRPERNSNPALNCAGTLELGTWKGAEALELAACEISLGLRTRP